ncbi:MAG TPA: tetratricopeptide repeat protein [Candidatus Limnocylindrales bacterium]|nr:tetratricopeptide repeat protein [Candidatus Limnocylindrales bacterium]
MQPIRETWRTPLLCILLALATFAAFSAVLHNGFIKFDDGFYIVHNPHVASGVTLDNLRWALGSGYQGNWHPLTWFSHMLDVQLFGMRPGWHHLMNLLFHVANAVLLFVLLQRLTAVRWASFFVAALFALHPLHVESVAWAAERKDALSTLFLMLTLLAYVAYVKQQPSGELSRAEDPKSTPPFRVLFNSRRYVAALVLFVLGLMSKPMLVTVPFLLLLLDFWPLGRLQSSSLSSSQWKVLLREKLAFFALAALSSVITLIVQERGHATYLSLPLGTRLANAVASLCLYLGKTIWPTRLSIFYPHPATGVTGSGDWPLAGVFVAALALAAISVLAVLRRQKFPWFTTGWFWFLLTLLPVIGIVQVGGQAMADRYTYIPLIGLFICVVWGASSLIKNYPSLQSSLAVVGAAALVMCGVLSHRQTQFWRNDFTVFAHALDVTSKNALAHYHLGIAYRDQNQTAKAMEEFRAAVAADPTYAAPYPEIGAILEEQGKREEAFKLYEAAVKATPWAEQLHNLLGSRLWSQGKQEEALAHYAAALKCDSDYPDAHFNLGIALASLGQFGEAAAHFAAVCRLRPDDREALGCLAESLLKSGRLAQAEVHFTELTRLDPRNASAHENLGLLLVQRGAYDPALEQFQQAVALNPNWPDALNALAWLLATHPRVEYRKPVEAVKLAERACQLGGNKQARFWSTLDVAYAGAGRLPDAIQAATKARQLALAAGQTNAAEAAQTRLEQYNKQLTNK